MKGISPRQKLVLDVIQQSVREHGYPPSIREIGRALGFSSTTGVSDHIRTLVRKGYLLHDKGTPRGLRLTAAAVDAHALEMGVSGPAADIITVPVVSFIERHEPLIEEKFLVDTVRIERAMLRPTEVGATGIFGVRMAGDAMIEASILDGDYVLARRQASASHGEIVVALLRGECLVRQFFKMRVPHLQFAPANRTLAPIYVRLDQFDHRIIVGVVVGIFRRVNAQTETDQADGQTVIA